MQKMRAKKVFVWWLFSYILILCIPMLLGVVILNNARDIFLDDSKSMHEILQRQTAKMLNNTISEMGFLCNQISNNAELMNFANLDAADTERHRYTLVQAKQQLSQYTLPSMPQNYYIYINNIDSILTVSSLYTKEYTFAQFHLGATISQDAWFDSLRVHHLNEVRVMKNDEGTVTGVVMVTSLPRNAIYTPRATIVQIFETDFFSRMLSGIADDLDVSLLLMDSENNIISSSNGAFFHYPEYSMLTGESGLLNYTVGTEQYLAYYTNSSVPGWKYITVLSDAQLRSKTYPIRLGIWGFTLFSLVIGGILAYLLTLRNYGPMRRILASIGPYTQKTGKADEFQQIERAFSSILEERDALDHLWRKQAAVLQQEFWTSVLAGRVQDTAQTREIISSFEITLQSAAFCVMLICVPAASDNGAQGDRETLEAIQSSVVSALARKAANAQIYSVLVDNLIAVIVNLPEDSTPCDALQKAAQEELTGREERVFVTIGQPCRGLETVCLSYHEAMDAMDSTLLAYRNQMTDAEPPYMDARTGEVYYFASQREEMLILHLLKGKPTEAVSLFEQICREAYVSGRISYPYARCLYFDMASSVIKAIYRSGSGCPEALMQQIDEHMFRLHRAASGDEMHGVVRRLILKTGEILAPFAQKQSSLTGDITDCIKVHYMEPNFNVSRIAQYLSMNLSYLSKHFKDNTGIGLYDYISRIRINHAKELMAQSDVSIGEIAQQVGFENNASFIRVFKKLEGMTPGAYRSGS